VKLKALFVALAAAVLCVSVASAATTGHGRGKGEGRDHGRGNDPAQTTTSSDGTASTPTDGAGKHHGRGEGSGRNGGTGKGHKQAGDTTGATCRGRQVVLRGLFVSGSSDTGGAGSFVMVIKRVDGHGGKRLGLNGKQATVTVDSNTKVRRHGPSTLADLVANDRLSVKARACRAAASTDPAAEPAVVTLLARVVNARPAKADDTGTGTTTTGTTTTDDTPVDITVETDTGSTS
jgi:hypothetical protein